MSLEAQKKLHRKTFLPSQKKLPQIKLSRHFFFLLVWRMLLRKCKLLCFVTRMIRKTHQIVKRESLMHFKIEKLQFQVLLSLMLKKKDYLWGYVKNLKFNDSKSNI